MSGANEAAAAAAATTTLPHVFVSYAREDANARDTLVEKLTALQTQGVLTFWVDDALNALPGKFGEAIQAQLARADIFVALVSDAWLGSAYVKEHEAKAMDRPGVRCVAVLLHGVTWEHAPLFATHHLMFADANKGLGGLLNLEGDAQEAGWQKVVRAIANHAREVRRRDQAASDPQASPLSTVSRTDPGPPPPEALSVADLARRMGTEHFAVGSAAPSPWVYPVVGALLALAVVAVLSSQCGRSSTALTHDTRPDGSGPTADGSAHASDDASAAEDDVPPVSDAAIGDAAADEAVGGDVAAAPPDAPAADVAAGQRDVAAPGRVGADAGRSDAALGALVGPDVRGRDVAPATDTGRPPNHHGLLFEAWPGGLGDPARRGTNTTLPPPRHP